MERIVVREAVESDKPVLGICRGIQFINAALGGILFQDADMDNPSIDSICMKVNESSNDGEKPENEAVDRTKGTLNRKIYAFVDGLGNPVAFLLSPGNDNGSTHAIVKCFFQKIKWFCRVAIRLKSLKSPSLHLTIWLLS